MTGRTPEAAAAVKYHTEQLWETTRGLIDAFKIDQHKPEVASLPFWSDLSDAQRVAFGLLSTDAVGLLRIAAEVVTRAVS